MYNLTGLNIVAQFSIEDIFIEWWNLNKMFNGLAFGACFYLPFSFFCKHNKVIVRNYLIHCTLFLLAILLLYTIWYFAWEDQSAAKCCIFHIVLVSYITVLSESNSTVMYMTNWANTVQLCR